MQDEGSPVNKNCVIVNFTDKEMAALEGWRVANAIESTHEAARQLVRRGLLDDIGRTYRMITDRDIGSIAPSNGEHGGSRRKSHEA
ncbi:MAG: hypothetical protein GC150_14290 [Rhizobiales bacterium]|nr:hypothetical protein [Hyphomicrobiales bacterium]